eukprot:5481940-Amphidinium_carterae.1
MQTTAMAWVLISSGGGGLGSGRVAVLCKCVLQGALVQTWSGHSHQWLGEQLRTELAGHTCKDQQMGSLFSCLADFVLRYGSFVQCTNCIELCTQQGKLWCYLRAIGFYLCCHEKSAKRGEIRRVVLTLYGSGLRVHDMTFAWRV